MGDKKEENGRQETRRNETSGSRHYARQCSIKQNGVKDEGKGDNERQVCQSDGAFDSKANTA